MNAIPEVMLSYQADVLQATREHDVVVCEKSRRIGVTWAIAADAVLTASSRREARGSDVLYIGYNQDLGREFIDTCSMWARNFKNVVVESFEEFMFPDGSEAGVERFIQAFRIRFDSKFEIVALTSRPRSLRGRQGFVILDEAAFHDDLGEVLKAALALLIWGGRLLVISTHDGAENAFAELVEECRSGKRPFRLLRISFDDAIRAGLYKRICLVRGIAWSEAGEAEWVKSIRDYYGDDAAEELDCIPSQGGGKYLTRALLEARATPIPVLRWTLPDAWVDLPEDTRVAECNDWLRENVDPLLEHVADLRSFIGEDFARSGDLTIMWPLQIDRDLTRRTPFILELRNVPFTTQWQVLRYLGERLPRFSGAALDAGANGAYIAEAARQHWGPEIVREEHIGESWYREQMPPLKAAIQDATIELPRDAEIVDDFRTLELIRGVPRPPEKRTQAASGQRHGDAAIACALALYAARTIEGGPIRFVTAGRLAAMDAFRGEHTRGAKDY